MSNYPIPSGIPITVPTTVAPLLPPREPDPDEAPEDLWAPYSVAGIHERPDHGRPAPQKAFAGHERDEL